MVICIWLTCCSTAPTRSLPPSSSLSTSTAMARASCVSTRPPIASTPLLICSISASNCLCVCSFMCVVLCARALLSADRSSEPSGDVILGFLPLRPDEQRVGGAEFDQLAEVHVRGEVRHTRCLLHVVSDHGDGVLAL